MNRSCVLRIAASVAMGVTLAAGAQSSVESDLAHLAQFRDYKPRRISSTDAEDRNADGTQRRKAGPASGRAMAIRGSTKRIRMAKATT